VQPDISNLWVYDWYDWCYCCEESNIQFPFQKEQLGHILGPTKNEGNQMVQAVLKSNGVVVPCCTPRPLTVSEIYSPTAEQKKHEIFNELFCHKLGDSVTIAKTS